MNLILKTDSYKQTHANQYAPGTKRVYSYIEARAGGAWPQTVFFGLQMWLKSLEPVTWTDIAEAEERVKKHFGRDDVFNMAGWDHVYSRYEGRLPVEIRALPEGAVVPVGTPLVTIENTDDEAFWLPEFLETALLRAVWYPTTVATKSWTCKRIIKRYLDETCDMPDEAVKFALHDFGGRGVSSGESAGIGGCAHLVNFLGTDTLEGLEYANQFYGADMAGFSIPAMQHGTVISWGPKREAEAYRNMIEQYAKPGSMLAMVMDSYNLFDAIALVAASMGQKIRDSGARIVFRPDSGDPVKILPEVLKRLAMHYGVEHNKKGYAVLHPSVRAIWGDGIDEETIPGILDAVKSAGFSTENAAFGMGGGLLQKLDRDTLRFAMKCSWVETDQGPLDVCKTPATDLSKRSKAGRFAVITEGNGYETVPQSGNEWRNLLKPVFRNGVLLKDWTFDEVRANAAG